MNKLARYLLLILFFFFARSSIAQNQPITGSISTTGADCSTSTNCVILNLPQNYGSASITISGTFSGTLQFEASGDGTNYTSLSASPIGGGSAVTSTTSGGTWQVKGSGMAVIRMRASALASGTAVVTFNGSQSSLNIGGSGGGSSGTVSGQAAGVIPLGTTATSITQQSHLDDGNTTAGTITSSEPITSTGAITAGSAGGVGGTLTLPEGTAASAAAAKDICYGDSTAHAIKCAFNNGSFAQLLAGFPTLDQILSPAASVSFTAPATDTYSFLGTAPSSASAGVNAGNFFNVTSPAGGACTGAACTGGAAGSYLYTGAAGGSVAGASGNAVGGAGSNYKIILGPGVAGLNAGAAGAMGQFTVQPTTDSPNNCFNNANTWPIQIEDAAGTHFLSIQQNGTAGSCINASIGNLILQGSSTGNPIQFFNTNQDTWTNGLLTKYDGIALVGDGQSYTTGHANVAAFSTTQSGNVLASPVANHAYKVNYYLWQEASGSGGTCLTSATATVAITWHDPSTTAQTQTFTALNLPPTLVAGAWQSGTLPIVTASGTAIAYSITYANGNCSTQPTAQAQIWAEASN